VRVEVCEGFMWLAVPERKVDAEKKPFEGEAAGRAASAEFGNAKRVGLITSASFDQPPCSRCVMPST